MPAIGIRGAGSSVTCATFAVTSSVRRKLSPFIKAAMKVKTTTPIATPAISSALWRREETR